MFYSSTLHLRSYRILTLITFFGFLSLFPLNDTNAALLTTASHKLPSTATGWFSAGAGKALDGGTIFDNRLAQTFTSTVSGTLQTVSFIATRYTSTNADLRVSLTALTNGQPTPELTTVLLEVDSFEVGSLSGRPDTFNVSADFSMQDVLIEAQQEYAIVFLSDTADANYRIYGDRSGYSGGTSLDFQNSGPFEESTSASDLFFEVVVKTIPEPTTATLLALTAPAWLVNGTAKVRHSHQSTD